MFIIVYPSIYNGFCIYPRWVEPSTFSSRRSYAVMGVVDPTPEGGRIPGDGWHADHGWWKWWKTLKKMGWCGENPLFLETPMWFTSDLTFSLGFKIWESCWFLVGKAWKSPLDFQYHRGVANVPARRPGDARPPRGVARPPDGGGGMGGWSHPHGAPFDVGDWHFWTPKVKGNMNHKQLEIHLPFWYLAASQCRFSEGLERWCSWDGRDMSRP